MQKEGIIFKPSTQYFQEIGKTIMDITRAIILDRHIDNNLWPKLIPAMIYVKIISP